MADRLLILFDFDGVIADSFEHVYKVLSSYAAKYKIPPITTRKEFIHYFTGNIYDKLMERGVSKNTIRRLAVKMRMDYSREVKNIRIFQDIDKAIEELAKMHILYIISSNFTASIRGFCKKNGIYHSFKGILGADKGLKKVDKINKTIKKLKTKREKCYYIGDTVGDIIEGRQAGVKTVAVTWGYQTKRELAVAEPNYICERPAELTTLFQDILHGV